MFIYMHYDGPEPVWATSLRGLVPAFTPAYPFEQQEASLGDVLTDKNPAERCLTHKDAFQLDESLWKPLSEAREILGGADKLISTNHLVWRDQWLLSRADVVLVENGATLEIPVLADLWGIPVVALSFAPTGMHPWLAHSARITINSPTHSEDILGALGVQAAKDPEAESLEQETAHKLS